jgi:hypothetical protein
MPSKFTPSSVVKKPLQIVDKKVIGTFTPYSVIPILSNYLRK